jgi:hypothetical protein
MIVERFMRVSLGADSGHFDARGEQIVIIAAFRGDAGARLASFRGSRPQPTASSTGIMSRNF